jgi:hypothetical protein
MRAATAKTCRREAGDEADRLPAEAASGLKPQDHVAVALAGAAEGREAIGDGRLEPDQAFAPSQRRLTSGTAQAAGALGRGQPGV